MKVAIIGAGWFGCHLANKFLAEGMDVAVYERNGRVFSGASGNNTSKLHLGFHYPRSKSTRMQIKWAYDHFVREYPFLLHDTTSLYAIARKGSLLDFNTYLDIMDASGLEYTLESAEEAGLREVEGVIGCPEKTINIDKAREFFAEELSGVLSLNTIVEEVSQDDRGVAVNGRQFDLCINTTNNHFLPVAAFPTRFEKVLIPLYKMNDERWLHRSVVVLDGPFVSINPFLDQGVLRMSSYHVEDSILQTSAGPEGAVDFDEHVIQDRIVAINACVARFLPSFSEAAEPAGYRITDRAKYDSASANRECMISADGRLLHIYSGKISTVFSAEQFVRRWIHANVGSEVTLS